MNDDGSLRNAVADEAAGATSVHGKLGRVLVVRGHLCEVEVVSTKGTGSRRGDAISQCSGVA